MYLAPVGSPPHRPPAVAFVHQLVLHDALVTLTPEQHLVLRLHYVEGLVPERMAPLFGVHRTTVNRRLIEAREYLQKETRRLLRERLHLSPEEFESLAGLVRSQLELSLVRVLKKKN